MKPAATENQEARQTPERFRQWIVRRAPHNGSLTPENFEERIVETPSLAQGEALVRIKVLNIHSATRLRMIRGLIREGETDPHNYACAEVIRSRDQAFASGDIVACQAGWQEYQVIRSSDPPVGFPRPNELVKALNGTCSPWTYVFRPALARQWPAPVLMEIFGTSGMTAWFGLREYGPIMPTDTVAVAATTGAVGAIVAQLAKAAGARVIGFAGGPARCRWVVDTLGIDGCIDYRSPTLEDELAAAFPEGIDVFSDGVGGDLTGRVVALMKRHGRLFSYGSAAASYSPNPEGEPAVRPTMRETFGISREIERLLRDRHIKSGAWTVDTFYHDRIQAENDLARLLWMQRLRPNARVVSGFENLPRAVADLYRVPRAGKLQISLE
ncbi:zinc-binding dehydrogenase [Paraburkholderia caledonica]|uniref:NADPH-dependent curcumin reductase CurA n=1 Tax=Paraburkholderia caledonica TaxID=134536 RepID=A0AB73IM82_9BURK|nr:NADPH-dependent curcumin reductase CurA [Paraburkholderia caledonica]